MDALIQDLRYAVRMLLKNRSFTAVAVLTLALGIGANAAIFSVLDGVMLRPLPYPDIERILMLNERTTSGQAMSVSWQDFQDWRDQNEVFEQLGVFRPAIVNLTGGDQPERLNGSLTSSAIFGAMGISPLAGRSFSPDEDRDGAERVAIISERLWRSHFNADPATVGRTVLLNSQPHIVVGIMPASMRFPSRLTDVWLPLGLFVKTFPTARAAHPGLTAMGKLKAGVSVEQATAAMDTIARRLGEQYPQSNRNTLVTVVPYYEQIVRNIRPALLVLIGAVAFVLLIGCANLANLMLSKAEARHREIAIRSALGAERRRIIQQLLTESVLLAGAGGALGALFAYWAVKAFVASQPTTVPRIDLIGVDGRVLAFVALVSIATGVLFGLVPALRASSPDLLTTLKESVRGSAGAAARRFRSALVVAEVALALMLLVGAGLMIRSFARLMAVDPGFTPERVVTMRLTLPDAKYPTIGGWTSFHQELIRRVTALPAVEAAGVNSSVPLEGGGNESSVMKEGDPPPSPDRPPTMTLFQTISPDYFAAMGIQLLKGRVFTDRDAGESTLVAVVDESLVRKLFPNDDPIGKRFSFESRGHGPDAQPIWREIIGVVRHVRHYGIAGEPPFGQVYTPFTQLPVYMQDRRPGMALMVRTRLEPQAVAASIRREVAAIDRDIPLWGVQTMDTYLAQNTEQPRLSMMLLTGFGALALVLSIVGIYGVLSYTVSQRTQEIGIRMALGASRRDVMRLVVGQGMVLTAIGIALGLALSYAASRWLTAMLFQVSPHDPPTFAIIAALLALVAFAATCVPGLRATRVSPIEALRYE
jgi:putative ABC transport system permease protein